MVERQLRGRGITDERVLDAMAAFRGRLFLDADDRERRLSTTGPSRSATGRRSPSRTWSRSSPRRPASRPGDKRARRRHGLGLRGGRLRGARRATCTRSSASPSWPSRRARRLRRGRLRRASGSHVGDGSLGLPDGGALRRDRRRRGRARASAWRSTSSSSRAAGSSSRSGTPAAQRLEVAVRSPEGPAILRSVPCRFVPLVGAERLPPVSEATCRVYASASMPRDRGAVARAGHRRPRDLALRRPANWVQLAKFAAVGALRLRRQPRRLLGARRWLDVHYLVAARLLLPRRRDEQLHVEPGLDVPRPARQPRPPGRSSSCSSRPSRSPPISSSSRLLVALGLGEDPGAGDRDRARDALELRREQALELPARAEGARRRAGRCSPSRGGPRRAAAQTASRSTTRTAT